MNKAPIQDTVKYKTNIDIITGFNANDLQNEIYLFLRENSFLGLNFSVQVIEMREGFLATISWTSTE